MADFYHKRKSIKFIGAIETQTDRFTIYPSPYMVFTNGGRYTKHIYIGSERIVSKVAIDNGYNPATTPTAAYGNNTYVTRLNNKSVALNDSVEAIYTKFQLPYNGLNNDNIIPGFQPALMSLASTASSTDNYEEYSYYIHSDHLGSTSYITDSDGEVSQHVEYVPFGEVFIEELSSSAKLNTPFLFNGKELDEETGLYYYGARYYDPRLSLWLSTDPMELKYPNISTYTYCANNPIKRKELDGQDWVENENGDITWNVNINASNHSQMLKAGEIYRGISYSREKVWNDVSVNGNSESGLMKETYLPTGSMTYHNQTPWIDMAVEEMKKGFNETGNNPEILKYFNHTQLKNTPASESDQTPWCATFVNYCLESSGIDGTKWATAYSFKGYGETYSKLNPKYGSIAIMNYSHVGFVIGQTPNGRIILLGGNQNNAINLSPNSIHYVIHFVYPSNYNPSNITLPILDIKGRSLNFNSCR